MGRRLLTAGHVFLFSNASGEVSSVQRKTHKREKHFQLLNAMWTTATAKPLISYQICISSYANNKKREGTSRLSKRRNVTKRNADSAGENNSKIPVGSQENFYFSCQQTV